MPRPPREDFPGAWHHVMNRGADHRDIFEHDTDRQVFLDSAVEAGKRHHLEIHAYCLMTNHFHMLLRSQDGQLAAGMQFLSGDSRDWSMSASVAMARCSGAGMRQ